MPFASMTIIGNGSGREEKAPLSPARTPQSGRQACLPAGRESGEKEIYTQTSWKLQITSAK